MSKKWIQQKDEMEKVLIEADVGFLGMIQADKPYVIPMSFAYYQDRILLHSALKGLKLDCIRTNPEVCFSVSQQQLIPNTDPCEFSIRYRSVIARGKAEIMNEPNEKLTALNIIAAKYAKGASLSPIDPQKVRSVAVIVIKINEITGKYNVDD